jgi:hypothetical protein
MQQTTEVNECTASFSLPPLILHPFSSTEDSSCLIESSRASLIMQGLLPATEQSPQNLDTWLLRGRYAELRMLFYVGKDLTRWLEQCTETSRVDPRLSARSLADESFTPLLVEDVPERVRTKLESWGVLDFKSLFRRALGLHMVFSEPPPVECLSLDFLRRYNRYVDGWFELKMTQRLSTRCSGDEFTYELYASGEYTQMLEQSWKI